MYYVVSLISNQSISPLEKKPYINSLWGTSSKMGTIKKFGSAIMKKKDLLYNKMYAIPYGNVIAEFYFKKEEQELAFKWKSFLSKVYPNTLVDINLKRSLPSRIDFILGYILSGIEDYPVTIELSLPEKLNKKEMKQVEELIQSVKSDNLYYLCRQFKCGTCQENNPNSPIHFEIDYHYKWNRRQGIRAELGLPEEEKCFHCESIVTEDFCTVCERAYDFKV